MKNTNLDDSKYAMSMAEVAKELGLWVSQVNKAEKSAFEKIRRRHPELADWISTTRQQDSAGSLTNPNE